LKKKANNIVMWLNLANFWVQVKSSLLHQPAQREMGLMIDEWTDEWKNYSKRKLIICSFSFSFDRMIK
jgi:hypothetical protein